MKIIVTAVPLIGHLNPLLAAGRMLVDLGHEVVGYAPGAFRQNVESSGLRFHSFPPDADIDMRDITKIIPRPDPSLSMFARRRIAWQCLFVGRMRAEYRGLQTLLREFPADVILAESMFFGTMPMLVGPRAERPAIVHFGATFLQLTRDDKAPMFEGLPPARTAEEHEAYSKIADEARKEWFDPIGQSIDAMLAELDRPPMQMPFYDAAIRLPDLFLQTGVPGLEFPREVPPSTLHYIGATQPVAGLYPIPEWASDLDDGRKVVLVTQGTVANSDLDRLIKPTLNALSTERDLIVVATTGGRSVELLGPLPENARVAQFLPYDWLMPKLDLLVTNGGYGTVTHALSLGIPLVVAGTTEDKREVSARVKWSGVGLALGSDNPPVQQINEAVRQVLDNPSFATKAAMLEKEFRSHALCDKIGQLFMDVAQQDRIRRPS